ncbi:MAG TPA: NADH-quinone oxidoreductase subunit C [Longimicrobiales bacterium]|nr:NADH-quinone oxidoreductase subunit C [Longimicrobiales bacterium]
MAGENGPGLEAVEKGPEASGGVGRGAGVAAAEAEGAQHLSVTALRERFGEAVLRHEVSAGDEHVVYLEAERLHEIMAWLRDDPEHRYDLLRDVTAVDYGGGRPLQVVWVLWSIPHRRGLRVKCELPLRDLAVASVTCLWNAANWLEREVYDMFGVDFTGHPDLRRILMPENYAEGHPLRKDFPLRGRFTRAEQTRRALSQDPHDYYIPAEMEFGAPQMAEGTPAGRPALPDESEDSPGGVEGSV